MPLGSLAQTSNCRGPQGGQGGRVELSIGRGGLHGRVGIETGTITVAKNAVN